MERFPGTSFVTCANTVAALQAIASDAEPRESAGAEKPICPRIDSEVVARWLHRFHALGLV
jgi:hypothetical protein